MELKTIGWFTVGFVAVVTATFIIFAVIGGIGLWALNTLGYLQPFEWTKAIAIGVLILLIGGSAKR